MSFTGSPARKNIQSPLGLMHRGSPRGIIQSPGTRKKKNALQEDEKTPENCDPNVKVSWRSHKSKVSETGNHVCQSRRCAAIHPDWDSTQFRPQPRKFLVAKRHERPQETTTVCKCCEKKSGADKSGDAGRKCARVASEQLKASQERFVKENFKRPSEEKSESEARKSSAGKSVANEGQSKECGSSIGCPEIQEGTNRCPEIQEVADGFSVENQFGSEIDGTGEKDEVSRPENGGCMGYRSEEGCKVSEFSGNQFRSGIDGNAVKIVVSGMENEGMDEKKHCSGGGCTCSEQVIKGSELSGKNGFSKIEENQFRFGIDVNKLKIGSVDQKMHRSGEGFKGSELVREDALPNCNASDTLASSPRRMSPAPRRPRNELLAEAISSIPQQAEGRVKHLVKAFESLMSLPDYETTEGYQARLLDGFINNVSDIDEGKRRGSSVRKGVKWSLPGMQPLKSEERLPNKPNSSLFPETYDNQASPLGTSIYDVSDSDQGTQRAFGVCGSVKWALVGMQPQDSEERPNRPKNSPFHETCDDLKGPDSSGPSETNDANFRNSSQSESDLNRPHSSSPSHESCDDLKFPICEELALVGANDTQSVCSLGRSENSSGSRRRGCKDSLDSNGGGSLGRNGMRQWKKQLKVTCARPFKLRTEQRGHMKERDFVKKVQEMLADEEKFRIPVAQGLPYTTDEPEHLVKPPVKESTKPLEVKLHTEIRAVDRAEFDQIIAEKLNALEQQRLEEERLQKLAEEEEVKRLRKEMVPRAQPMPFFDRPFIPKRSSKSPTIPKEPKFHVPYHKRAECISWNEFNVCQQ